MIKEIYRTAKEITQNPTKLIKYALRKGGRILPDKWYLQLQWRIRTGRKLNLTSPRGFNEKLQWLKLYNRHSFYTQLADKYAVRDFVTKTIGAEHLVPLLGVWKHAQDIDFDRLPNQFVLKCTHNSGGGMCVCKDKTKLNQEVVRWQLKKGLKQKFYQNCREWVYKNIQPRIIAEAFLIDQHPSNTLGTLISYKFYCFNGEPKFLYVGADDISKGVKGELYLSVLDLDWRPTPFGRPDHKPFPYATKKPPVFEQMIEIAKKLSKGIPFVRVDLYWVNGQILFSEMTFYPGAGYGFFTPAEWEEKVGDWIVLPAKKAV